MVTINGISPLAVPADAQAIAAGEYHSMVMKQDGTVWATGKNYYGQLGDGTRTNSKIFKKVMSSGQFGTMVWSLPAATAVTLLERTSAKVFRLAFVPSPS